MTSFDYELPAAWLRRLAREDPDKQALVSASGNLTRAELDALSNGLAGTIAENAESGELVAILVDDPVSFVIAMFGALKSVRPFVVLDPTHPAVRLREILDDSTAVAMIATAGTLDLATTVAAERPIIRADLAEPTDEPVGSDIPVEPDTPAYLVYTSGSTGVPKGVIRTHGTDAALSHDVVAILGVGSKDRSAPLYSTAFAGAIIVTIRTILTGATLCHYPLNDLNYGDLADWLERQRISCLETIPSLFRSLLSSLEATRRFSAVRIVQLGAEAVTQNDVELFRKHCSPDAGLFVLFGSSESGASLGERADPDTPIDLHGAPAGFPMPNVEVRLVDEDGREVAPGATGEIVVESAQVSPGYWRAPDLTAEKFSPGTRPGTRIMHTGDLGRALPDGRIAFLGRADAQLKIRGFRIDPGEVELALMREPAILHAAVVGKPGPDGAKHLVAYFESGVRVDLQALRAALGVRLPAHAVPSRFFQIEKIPRTSTGKLDRRSLEARVDPADESGATSDDRGSEIEESLRGLFEEILHLPSVGLDEGFFDLGGDSLRAAALFAAIEKTYGLAYPLTVILEAATVRKLAAIVGSDLERSAAPVDAANASVAEELEQVILDVWRDVLGRPDLEPETDFFASGGDGRSAVRARDEIAAKIGRSFPLGMFVGFPTARELARALAGPEDQLRVERSVERLREGHGAALICLAGKGADILKFRPLAARLDEGPSVYGIRGFGLKEGWIPPADFDLLVELALDDIRDVQPRGPYWLVGHSSGGQLALEVARRLEERGEAIGLVGMVDSVHPKAALVGGRSLGGRIETFMRRLRGLVKEPRYHYRDWKRARRGQRARVSLGELDHSRHPDRWRNVGDIYLEAFLRSEHAPWDGPVVFYSPSASTVRGARTGWEDLVPNLEVVQVTGGHVSVLNEPHVAALARDISERIHRAAAVDAP